MADAQAPNGVSKRSKVVLRLDDGSLIGSVETLLGSSGGSEAVLLDYEAACRTGRAGKNELDRLDGLIKAFQLRVNGIHGIPRSELKSRNPYTQDVQRAIKRQRSLANGEIAAFASPDHLQPAATGQDVLGKCMEVLNRVYATCNTMPPLFNWSVKDVFYRPVSETFPAIAADYYMRITQPMTFHTIEHRIHTGYYHNAQQFCDDMRLLFNNCRQYNPMPTDPVRLACLKLSEVFEQQWMATGLCAEAQRSKRATAGIAAPKFEPEEYELQLQTKSHRSGGPAGGGRPDDLRRLQSHEVSSYREEEVEQHAINEEWLTDVATKLQELQPENLQVALNKFNHGVVNYDEEGEVELDLEKVDYASLVEVDAYIRQVLGLPPREGPGAGGTEAAAAVAAPAAVTAPAAVPAVPPLSGGSDAGKAAKRNTVKAEGSDDDYYDDEESEDDD